MDNADDKTNPDGTQTNAGDVKDKKDTKSFTQAELDQLFAGRAKSAEDAAIKKLLTELGVENVDAAKAILTKQKEADEAAKSELQKAQDQIANAKTEAEKAKSEKDAALIKARELLMKAEVVRSALSFKDANGNTFLAESVDDVWLKVDKASIKDGDGDTFTGVKEAVEQVAKDRPHWLTNPKNDGRPPKGTPPTRPANKPADEKDQKQPTKTFTL